MESSLSFLHKIVNPSKMSNSTRSLQITQQVPTSDLSNYVNESHI